MSFRQYLYLTGSLIGWFNAVKNGTILKRVFKVFAWRSFGSFMNKFK